jgi:inner membrane protein
MTIPASPAETTANLPSLWRRALAAPALKIVMIGGLFLLMLVPLTYIGGLIRERQGRQAEVLAEFRSGWGPQQTLLGPILVVPYRTEAGQSRRFLHLAPSELRLTAVLRPETRKRGMFRATVYGAKIEAEGSFRVPRDLTAKYPADELAWENAFVFMRADDLRGLPATALLGWNGEKIAWSDCVESGEPECDRDRIVVARLRLSAAPLAEAPLTFTASLELRGTEAFWAAPVARDAEVTVTAPWSTPSFVGMPARNDVTESGFAASWHSSNNLAARRWMWVSPRAFESNVSGKDFAIADTRVGVALLEAVPTYLMVDRAAKYGPFFLALSFLTYFLFETIARTRIHLVQYAMMGLSITLFALLLISVSEPLGFTAGYVVSALMVLLQASAYTTTVTRQGRHTRIFAGVLAALFAFLYIVLSLETYALLVGSVALFAALSVMMAVTRHIEWSRSPSALAPAAVSGPKVAARGWLDLD